MRRTITRPKKEHPRGVVLLLALIVIAALTAAGIGASTIVINEFRTLASTDHGVRAFYAADIGIERSLFTVFNNRLVGTTYSDGSGPLSQVQNNEPAWNAAAGNPPPQNATTVTNAKSTTTALAKSISIVKSQTKQLDLTKDDQFYTQNPARSLYFKSSRIQTDDLDAQKNEPWLEISYVYYRFTAPAGTDVSPANATVRVVSKKNLHDGVKIILYTGQTTSTTAIVPVNPEGVAEIPEGINKSEISGYSVRFRALSEDIVGMTAYACTDDDDCVSTPSKQFKIGSDMNIVSRGSTDQASIILSTTVPIRFPATGVFDYVLFTEQTLDKPN